MNSKISELLNLYIKLSGEEFRVPDIFNDIEKYDKQIPIITKKIEKIEQGMNDNKYFDASSEIIDRNIEVSLEKKLDYLNNKLKNLKDKNESLIKEQKESEERYVALNKALASCQDFIYDLSKFDYEIASTSILKLIEMENERFDVISREINNKGVNKANNSQQVSDLNAEISALERNIQNEEDRLAEVKSSLKNRDTYVDEEAKNEDLKELNSLKAELDDIRNKRIEIINSVTYQTSTVLDELSKEKVDKEKVMSILSNIASRLNDFPYLNVEDETILEEEYNQLCSQRDELSAVIENKKYNLKNKKPYEIRYDYLIQKLNNAKDIKEDYDSLLKFIINQEIETTIDNLLKLKEEQKELENAFSSSDKAVQQRKYVEELISSYENDLTKTLSKARDIKEKIKNQIQEINEYNNEINHLGTEKKLHFDLENQAEKEYDNKVLSDILKKMEYLNNREEVGVTPNQILDQIEMLLYENETSDDAYVAEPDDFDVSIIKNYPVKEPDFTFDKIENPTNDSYSDEAMIISPEKYSVDSIDDTKEFSFSPIDDTGYVSFEDAYNSTK